ncbi:unannotated protein [freshwater metagenome]|jgi:ferredoxin|uniref:Unannotated protein n=1 Tax=freshwater metagenome TaxID=449393 RepID=A0A6J7HI77_9ZZZZ|nr:ferredoxin [Actinomycetota bacterium]
MSLTPSILADDCAGHGDCVDIAPEVFAIEGDIAVVIGSGPDELLMKAAESCPSVAIVLTDDAGDQVYP